MPPQRRRRRTGAAAIRPSPVTLRLPGPTAASGVSPLPYSLDVGTRSAREEFPMRVALQSVTARATTRRACVRGCQRRMSDGSLTTAARRRLRRPLRVLEEVLCDLDRSEHDAAEQAGCRLAAPVAGDEGVEPHLHLRHVSTWTPVGALLDVFVSGPDVARLHLCAGDELVDFAAPQPDDTAHLVSGQVADVDEPVERPKGHTELFAGVFGAQPLPSTHGQ